MIKGRKLLISVMVSILVFTATNIYDSLTTGKITSYKLDITSQKPITFYDDDEYYDCEFMPEFPSVCIMIV